MAAAADKRADLDVQISLLAEHEVTELTRLVRQMAHAMGIPTETDGELTEAEQDIAPEAVLDEIEKYDTSGDR
jgi:uncharacterized membrane protein